MSDKVTNAKDFKLDRLQSEIEVHLNKIAKLLPPSYKLTLLARCSNPELKDADIMLTTDNLQDIDAAVKKRIENWNNYGV